MKKQSFLTRQLTLREQVLIYTGMFGVTAKWLFEQAQTIQSEMSAKDKRELKMLVFAPENFSTADAWQMVKEHNQTYTWIDPTEIKPKDEAEESTKAIIAFVRYGQEPDRNTLGEQARSTEDWEATGKKFMSPKERMIAGEFYRRAEDKQLDQNNSTLCPGSRSEHGDVPSLDFNPDHRRVRLHNVPPEYRVPNIGVRRVVSMQL